MLPKSYQEVEWLESGARGGMWLNTGYVPNTDTRFKARMQFGGTYGYMFGSRGESTNTGLFGFLYPGDGNLLRLRFGNTLVNVAPKTTDVIDVEYVENTLNVTNTSTGVTSTGSVPVRSLESENAVAVFGVNQNGTVASTHANNIGRLYSLTFSENDETKVNLVPCYRISDNKPGMYDTVRDLFLTNQGSGEFVTGPPVYPSMYRQTHPYEMGRRRKALISATLGGVLPSGYRQVEYLESTGTQWIDTGIVPHIGCELYCRFMYTNINFGANSYESIFMAGASSESSVIGFVYGQPGNSGRRAYYNYFYYGNSPYTSFNLGTAWHELLFESDGTLTVSDAFTEKITPTREIYGTYQNLIVFANSKSLAQALCRISSLTLAENNASVLNLIPCYRKSDNKPGMFDTVSKQFLTNQGTGEFILGSEV